MRWNDQNTTRWLVLLYSYAALSVSCELVFLEILTAGDDPSNLAIQLSILCIVLKQLKHNEKVIDFNQDRQLNFQL